MATLGYTGTGTSQLSMSYQFMALCKTTAAPTDGTVDKIWMYVKRSTGTTIGDIGIYNTSPMSPISNSYKSGIVITGITYSYAWYSYTYTGTKPTITSGNQYYLGWAPLTGYVVGRHRVNGSNGGKAFDASGNFNKTISVHSVPERQFSIYIEYTPASTSDIKSVNGILLANIGDINEVSIDDIKKYGGIDN